MNKIETSLTETFSEWVHKLNINDVPKDVVDKLQLIVMDSFGLMVSAKNEQYIKSLINALKENGDCTLVGHNKKVNPFNASIINGTAIHGEDFDDPVALLAAYGGRELAAIAGAVLEARMRSIPVMLDGFISSAAAAALTAGNRLDVLDHCMISHLSAEPGHIRLASALRMQPFFDLRMRLGEASGAAVATMIVRAALATHNGMATFAEAGVSKEA